MLLSAARGVGAALAQDEVVPDQYTLSRAGALDDSRTGRRYRKIGCVHGTHAALRSLFTAPCLGRAW